jgi:hypothetical protein
MNRRQIRTAGFGTSDLTFPPVVPPAAVASVTLSHPSFSLQIGASQQLTATVRDGEGNILTDRVGVWSSGNDAAATVSASGLVTGVAAGTVSILYTVEEVQGSAQATVVEPSEITSLTLWTSPADSYPPIRVREGLNRRIQVTARDQYGATVSLSGKTINWSTTNPAEMPITSTGYVSALTFPASATIGANVDGVTGYTNVRSYRSVAVFTGVVKEAFVIGDTVQLGARYYDIDGEYHPEITDWAWSTPSTAASVDPATGLVTMLAAGTIDVYATAPDGAWGVRRLTAYATGTTASILMLPSQYTRAGRFLTRFPPFSQK